MLPIKLRYLVNKNNTLRLRYTVAPIATASLCLTLINFQLPEVSFDNKTHVPSTKTIELTLNKDNQMETTLQANAINSAEDDDLETNMLASLELDKSEPVDEKTEEDKALELALRLEEEKKRAQLLIKPEPKQYNVEHFISQALDNHRDREGQIRRANKQQAPQSEIILASATSMPSGIIQPKDKHLKIGKGDTITGVLKRAGISASESYKAVQAMSEHLDPRHIRPGQMLTLSYNPEKTTNAFSKMLVSVDKVQTVVVEKMPNGKFDARLDVKEMKREIFARKTTVSSSLYGSAERDNIPASVIANAIRIYSWDIDFQRDIRKNDSLEVLYDQHITEDGNVAKNGNILYAKLTIGGVDHPIYRYKMKNGRVDYFTPKGYSIRKALLKTLVDGGRISSGYGMRKHPVLGYNKMHKGIDFAAPRGTPIYAAGDGTIEKASRHGGYGNYVRIRHNEKLKTAYAHMQKYARGIKAGKRVKQGDIIGYVGTTGRSTGPHLHYEVLVNGKQSNPNKLDLPTGEILRGNELNRFKAEIAKINRQYSDRLNGIKMASTGSNAESNL